QRARHRRRAREGAGRDDVPSRPQRRRGAASRTRRGVSSRLGSMRTPVCDLLGIEFPILAFSHCRDVVAAVTNAGGLGVLGAGTHSPEHLEMELSWIDDQVKGRPYGVDLLLPAKYEGADSGGLDRDAIAARLPAEHVAFVEDMLRRYDVPPLPEGADKVGRLDM